MAAKKKVAVKKANLPDVELQDKPIVSKSKGKVVAKKVVVVKEKPKAEKKEKAEKGPSRNKRFIELIIEQNKTDEEICAVIEKEFEPDNYTTQNRLSFVRSKLNTGAWLDGKYQGKLTKFTRNDAGKLVAYVKGEKKSKPKENTKAKIALTIAKLPKK